MEQLTQVPPVSQLHRELESGTGAAFVLFGRTILDR